MKKSLIVVALAALHGVAFAQSGAPAMNMGSSGAMQMQVQKDKATPQSHRLTGTVKKVDIKAKAVTLEHDAVQSLNWPAMTMTFKVQDDATIAKIKPGAKLDADMVQRGKDYVITNVR